MKTLFLFLGLSLTFGCSVEVKDDEKSQTDESTTTSTEEVSEELLQERFNPLEGICSYSNSPNKGCLKAVIAGANLTIGEFFYEIGPKEFSRAFASDIASSYHVELEAGETLALTRRVTQQNFYNHFFAAIEGSHSTYASYHSGLGNLHIENVSPGYYEAQLSKEFDLRVLNESNEVTGYKCAIVWTTSPADVQAGRESSLGESISEFQLRVFDESCNGAKVKKKPESKEDSE